MKILIITGIFPPDIGGPANFVPRIAGWLSKRDHCVKVLCWSEKGEDEGDGALPYQVFRISRKGSRLARFFKTVSRIITVGKDADLFFINGLNLEARFSASLLNKPEIHKVVGDRAWEICRNRGWYEGNLDEFHRSPGSMKMRFMRFYRDLSYGRAKVIITPSLYLKQILSNWNISPSEVAVIYNSTSIPKPSSPWDLPEFQGPTIITICRLVPWKGVGELIEILGELPQCRLIIAGDGPQRKNLEDLSRKNGVEKRVLFLGHLPKSKVHKLLKSSDIFVLNSDYEGLPHVILEAMIARVPVIATDVGGTSEVLIPGRTGFLIPPGNSQILSRTLKKILTESSITDGLVQNAYQMIQDRFEEEGCFQAYENQFLKLLDQSPAEEDQS